MALTLMGFGQTSLSGVRRGSVVAPLWLSRGFMPPQLKAKEKNIHFCLKTLKSVNPGNFPPVDTRKQKQDGFVRYLSRKEEKKR